MSKNKSKTVKSKSKPKLKKLTKKDIDGAKESFGPTEAKFSLEGSLDSLSVDVQGSTKALVFLLSKTYMESENVYELVKNSIEMYEAFKVPTMSKGFKESK